MNSLLHSKAIRIVIFATLVCWHTMSGAAPFHAQVIEIKFKKIYSGDGNTVMDGGFIPPNNKSVYWLKPTGTIPHLFTYEISSGATKDLAGILPNNELPESVSWSPSGQQLAFADGTNLWIISAEDGRGEKIDTSPNEFVARELYWIGGDYVLGACADGDQKPPSVCALDISTKKTKVLNSSPLGPGWLSVAAYIPSSQHFIYEVYGPDTGSFVFDAELHANKISNSKSLSFPGLNAASVITTSSDGIYAVTDTNIGNGDSSIALFLGNTRTGKWIQIDASPDLGDNLAAKLSPDAKWLLVVVWPASTNAPKDLDCTTYCVYLAAIPEAMRKELN